MQDHGSMVSYPSFRLCDGIHMLHHTLVFLWLPSLPLPSVFLLQHVKLSFVLQQHDVRVLFLLE